MLVFAQNCFTHFQVFVNFYTIIFFMFLSFYFSFWLKTSNQTKIQPKIYFYSKSNLKNYLSNAFLGCSLLGLCSSCERVTIAQILLRFETVDLTTRLLIPIIVLQNHNRYNILQAGHNKSLNLQAVEKEVS